MPAGTPAIPRPAILTIAVGGTIKRKIAEQRPMLDQPTILRINGSRQPDAKPPNPLAYKARPLEGIWATAPYLHNGSVPNLYELLQLFRSHTSVESADFDGYQQIELLNSATRP